MSKVTLSLLIYYVLVLLELVTSARSGDIKAVKLSTNLRPSETRSDKVSFSFLAPPAGVCINMDLIEIRGEGATSMLFRLECRSVVSITTLESTAPSTELTSPLTAEDEGQLVTVNYQRVMRTVELAVQNRDRLRSRLNGRNYKFKAQTVTVYQHGIACLDSAVFNKLNLFYIISPPECVTSVASAGSVISVQAYTGDKLNMTAVLKRFSHCQLISVSEPEFGVMSYPRGMTYIRHNTEALDTEKLWFYGQCENNSNVLLPVECYFTPSSLFADIASLLIVTKSTAITSDHIEVGRTSSDFSIDQPRIVLTLVEQEPYGTVMLGEQTLLVTDSFSVADWNEKSLAYWIANSKSAFTTHLTFIATSDGAPNLSIRIPVVYNPEIRTNISLLEATEGESTTITDHMLSVMYGISRDINFTVITPPNHGLIATADSKKKLTNFTNLALGAHDVVYFHDGSESISDEITLRVSPPGDANAAATIILPIIVRLLNDNPPTRNSSTMIRVVKDKDTRLTSADIQYTDADIHQKDKDISLERRGIFCGDLMDLRSLTPVYKFTQADIDSGHIVFRHTGEDICKLVIWVSDGIHPISEVLEIRTMVHEYSVGGSRVLSIERGGQTILNESVLSIESNTRVSPENIIVSLDRFPQHGNVIGPTEESNEFTYQDMLDNLVLYVHVGSLSIADNFRINIEFDGIMISENIEVAINTDPSLLKPVIQANLPVAGHSGSFIQLDGEMLSLYHPLASTSDIVYQISNRHSKTNFHKQSADGSSEECFAFTQRDVDRLKVFYLLGTDSKELTLLASFKSVSTDLIFRSIVISDTLQSINPPPLSLMEGAEMNLTTASFNPQKSLLRNSKLVVHITEAPRHGWIYMDSARSVDTFTWSDLSKGSISYRHDNSETGSDSWSYRLTYISEETTSEVVTQKVTVVPVNDHIPSFNQTGELPPLVLWIGDDTVLTNRSLLIRDADSTSDSLVYTISSLPHDLTIHRTSSGYETSTFTQYDVNQQTVMIRSNDGVIDDGPAQTLFVEISDGNFQQTAQLNIVMKKKQLHVLSNQPMQVFPGLSYSLTTKNVVVESPYPENSVSFSVKAPPSHGQLTSSSATVTDAYIITYSSNVSRHLLRKLCRDIHTVYVSDKFTLTAHDDQLAIERSVPIRVNVSFLHIDNRTMQNKMGLFTRPLYVELGRHKIISSAVIENSMLVEAFQACDAGIQLGYQLLDNPAVCELSGLDDRGIAWHHDLSDNKITIFCGGSQLALLDGSIQLKPLIKQHGAVFYIEKQILTIPVKHRSRPPMIVTRNHTIFLLQGLKAITLTSNDFSNMLENTRPELFTIASQPANGKLKKAEQTLMLNQFFSSKDLNTEMISYRQFNMMLSSDSFELLIDFADGYPSVKLIVNIIVRPNILSTDSLIISGKEPVKLTVEHLNARPLLKLSEGEAVYHIVKPLRYGRLERASNRSKRAVGPHDRVTTFSHSEVENEVIIYYPPLHTPTEREDNFTYTLLSAGVQPADGVFTVSFNKSGIDTLTIAPVQQSSVMEEAALTILLAVVCVLVCTATLVVTVLCLRRAHRRKRRLARKALLNSEPRLILTKENGSYKLLVAGSGDLTITPLSSPPSPSREIDPSKESEISFTVPQVRVTPLIEKDGTYYDLHDYVNCEDLPSYRSSYMSPTMRSAHNYSNALDYEMHGENYDNAEDDFLHGSFEQLPPIKRPQYSSS